MLSQCGALASPRLHTGSPMLVLRRDARNVFGRLFVLALRLLSVTGMQSKPVLLIVSALGASGCTGLSLGQNMPGQDTYLEAGEIAVSPTTENAFVLSRSETDGQTYKSLVAIPADNGPAAPIMDLSSYGDLRILFPGDDLLLMGENSQGEQLIRLNGTSYAVEQQVQTEHSYGGTRLSQDGQWLAVADGAEARSPLNIINTQTLAAEIIPHNGEWVEAMWAHSSNKLFAIVFYDGYSETARARILMWDIDAVATAGFVTNEQGLWPDPELDVAVANTTYDLLFSFTWIGVSPDDQTAVFPVLQRDEVDGEWVHRLIVLDAQNAATAVIDDAYGPVGFTPDGSSIVSYRYLPGHEDTPSALLLIGTEDHQVLSEPLALGLPSFFVSHAGNFVLVANAVGTAQLVLYDVDMQTQTTLEGPEVALTEFVARTEAAEIYSVDDGLLYKVDLENATAAPVSLSFSPSHVNIQTQRDRLVLSDLNHPVVNFWSPDLGAVIRSVALPVLAD